MQIHRARLIWLAPGRYLAPGEIRVDGAGRIVSLARCRARKAPPRLILPGLVNAHVHLQLPALKRRHRSFLAWVRAVLRDRRVATDEDHRRRATAALTALVADGVTAVGEVDSTGLSPAILRSLPVAGRCYQEVLGLDLDARAARRLVQQRLISGSRWCPVGLSPHAPYSASPALFRAVARTGRPLSVHVAETPEEVEFLHRGRGPFRDLLAELGRLPPAFRAPGKGPVAFLDALGLLSPRSLLVHAQHVSAAETKLIRRRGAPVVVCPGTIRYFRRRPPPVARWLREGICVALGTDSRASNETLSLRSELAVARALWPELSAETLLAMATCNGGRALSRPSCGSLIPDGPANFITLRLSDAHELRDVLQGFVAGQIVPDATWLRGGRFRVRRSVEAASVTS
ncbi:MAG: amidohydrolase family protein [Planctomycetota bacterium]|jgi:cytosine/adenosine deaminase-related metal-dependent hydrolase